MSSYISNLLNSLNQNILTNPTDNSVITYDISYKKVTAITTLSVASCSLFKIILRRILNKIEFYKIIKNKNKLELNVIAILHSILLTGYGIKQIFYSDNTSNNTLDNANNCRNIISISLGYFIHDLIEIRSSWIKDPSILLHHLMAIILNSTALCTPKIFPMCAPFAIVELSSIFLNIMYILRMTNQTNTCIFKANLIAFVSTFFATRIVWMPYVIIQTYNKEPMIHLGNAQLILPILSSLNFWWFKGILKKVYEITYNKKTKKN